MIKVYSKKGFTLTEVIASALIIVISAAGTFSAYLYARKFSDSFQYKTMAANAAAEISDHLRYVQTYSTVASDANILDNLNWATTYPALNTLNGKVRNLSAGYTVNDVYFDNSGVETWAAATITANGGDANHTNDAAWNYAAKIAKATGDLNYIPDGTKPAASPIPARPPFKKIVINLKWDKIQ